MRTGLTVIASIIVAYALGSRTQPEPPRIFNPEVPPDAVYGDVGYWPEPPRPQLDRRVRGYWWRVAVAITGVFALAVIVMILFAWFVGVLSLYPLVRAS